MPGGWAIRKRVERGVVMRCEQRCEHCTLNLHGESPRVHHIKPPEDGGAHTLANLIVLCPNCSWKLKNGDIDQATLKQIIDEKELENTRINNLAAREIDEWFISLDNTVIYLV